ncbi:hypothetical protein GCM10010185_01680 [Saccharothrix coeruleofusca]|uniref:Uncharacterized protein n=1 Tax=Saccharothrix coeruleofusca TaxID=33919 RepID=A0A918AFT0_9PSEU|nr:hypothetical protein GCM10010185_01680 [Saccharothrix coeruleofusca]
MPSDATPPRITAIIASSRSAHLYAVMLVALGVLCLALGNRTIAIALSTLNRANRLPYSELCAVVAASTGTWLLRPRFWQWDRVGTRRAAVVAATCAVVGTLAPQLIVVAGSVNLPPGTPWAWVACNALLYSALVFCLAPVVGPGPAAGATLLLYFAVAVVNNVWPTASRIIPVSPYPGPGTHWTAALVLTAAAAVVHARTRGATAWTQRERDHD